jgi:serine protease Do
MTDPRPTADTNSRMVNRMLLAAASAAALFAGFAAAPTVFSAPAAAKQITVAPGAGGALTVADLVEQVMPAVVSLEVTAKPAPRAGARRGEREIPPEMEELLRRYGLTPPEGQERERQALGSGFFIDSTGTIVTNHHVVEDATEIKVKTNDGRSYTAELIGSDEPTDVAVLRIKNGAGVKFPFVSFSSGARARVGEDVIAVGNPFGLEGSVTKGIVSAIGRREMGSNFVDFLQIDAPINRGNSGGPTFNLQGQVIGVNSAIISPTGGSVGIGFAIPAATADNIVKQLMSGGKVSRGWLGVEVQPMDEDLAKTLGLKEPTGALVANVFDGSPAKTAGIKTGDLILSVDGDTVKDQGDLTRKVGGGAANRTAKFEVLRDGQRRMLNVKLGERPDNRRLASMSGDRTDPPAEADKPAEVRQVALGVEVRPLTDQDRKDLSLSPTEMGLVITDIEANSDLFEKGVREGHVLLQAGDRDLKSNADLDAAIASAKKAGQPVKLLIQTQRRKVFVAVDPKEG